MENHERVLAKPGPKGLKIQLYAFITVISIDEQKIYWLLPVFGSFCCCRPNHLAPGGGKLVVLQARNEELMGVVNVPIGPLYVPEMRINCVDFPLSVLLAS